MAFPHSISEKANKSATGACCWSNEAVSLFMDRHHFYDYFHLFGLATIHMPFFGHGARSLGSVWPVMTFCVKIRLTATTIWLVLLMLKRKDSKLAPDLAKVHQYQIAVKMEMPIKSTALASFFSSFLPRRHWSLEVRVK